MRLLHLLKGRRGDDPRLHGQWRIVRSEDPEVPEPGETIDMYFSPDGKLTYVVTDAERVRVMNLVYFIDGNEIVSNQPSEPKEHRTRYAVEPNGQLVLENDGLRSWLARVPAGSQPSGAVQIDE